MKLEAVKINSEIVKVIRRLKNKTGITITRFVEDAIKEKFEREISITELDEYKSADLTPKKKKLTWKEKAEIQYAENYFGSGKRLSADELSERYGVPIETIYALWSQKKNAADKEFERVTGKNADQHIDDFLKWRNENL